MAEIDYVHKGRTYQLVKDVLYSDITLCAYTAVLLKDVLWSLNELLAYKQNETPITEPLNELLTHKQNETGG